VLAVQARRNVTIVGAECGRQPEVGAWEVGWAIRIEVVRR
jgi:hypothetical protein